MSSFRSKGAYSDFVHTVVEERRWIFDEKTTEFLVAVRAASRKRARSLKVGTRLCRAQRGSEFATVDDIHVEEEHPLPEKRMVPEPSLIRNDGRANPPGFAYLYLATTPATALAEMRPWIGEPVTLAIFELLRSIKLVVCQAGAEDWEQRLFDRRPSVEKRDQHVWNDISRAFARPVARDDQEGAYVPTQILAEVFKAAGFDGLAYRSSLERGTNIVLFDLGVAKPLPRCRYVYRLKRVSYDFNAAPDRAIYFDKDGASQCMTAIHTESP